MLPEPDSDQAVKLRGDFADTVSNTFFPSHKQDASKAKEETKEMLDRMFAQGPMVIRVEGE